MAEDIVSPEAGGAEEDIRETDLTFDCPACGKSLVIDYRAAGLQIACSECGERILVPIPEGMRIDDLDLDVGEVLQQLFATRKNYQKAELEIQSLRDRLLHIQEALSAMQAVVTEGLGK